MRYGLGSPVIGWCTVIVPTDGSCLYVCEDKLSQMSLAIARLASGLHALVSSKVTGTRISVDSVFSSRKSSFITMSRIFFLKSSVLVHAQYLSKQAR